MQLYTVLRKYKHLRDHSPVAAVYDVLERKLRLPCVFYCAEMCDKRTNYTCLRIPYVHPCSGLFPTCPFHFSIASPSLTRFAFGNASRAPIYPGS
jgi:hypothetical protein